ncbi:hypothetical protein CPLU01_06707 [Colletotrichum plurivorum]|uniref:Uncharacterized protein n=1 Tax=Colletotrichum plurivorum TaxID=2175906 RepID=A0A8H6NGD6_9PEZI|nr:hypothetical protein CPLU01_06707 [Colletotrichum plurivorum]
MSTNLNPRHLQGGGSTPMSQNQAPPNKASTQHRSVGRIQGHYTAIKEKTEIIVQKYVDEGDPDPDTEPERHRVRQASYAPEYLLAQGKYPEVYENREPLHLQAETPLTSNPIVPSPRAGSPPRNWRSTNRPGPVRAVYNSTNREQFDVIYHDKNKQRGKDYDTHGKSKNAPFSLARYHPSQ